MLSLILLLCLFLSCPCTDSTTLSPVSAVTEVFPEPENAVYYWKTRFGIGDSEEAFLRRNGLNKIYLRMFDVTDDEGEPVPNATVKIDSAVLPESLCVVPVVYITLDGLRTARGKEDDLARKIVERVKNMCSCHRLPGVEELQLDCDWTASTEQSFFTLCQAVRGRVRCFGWRLSSTIRLHQLRHAVPPVDRGVLMVYNTGNFDDPDASNSIIDVRDVAPYMRHLYSYPLPLDVAYPAYSWQLLFRGRRFAGLMRETDTSDTTAFIPSGAGRHTALRDIPVGNTIIKKGDIIRTENPTYGDIMAVKELIDENLGDRAHANIIYHLDCRNLRNYSNNEIKNILR